MTTLPNFVDVLHKFVLNVDLLKNSYEKKKRKKEKENATTRSQNYDLPSCNIFHDVTLESATFRSVRAVKDTAGRTNDKATWKLVARSAVEALPEILRARVEAGCKR